MPLILRQHFKNWQTYKEKYQKAEGVRKQKAYRNSIEISPRTRKKAIDPSPKRDSETNSQIKIPKKQRKSPDFSRKAFTNLKKQSEAKCHKQRENKNAKSDAYSK